MATLTIYSMADGTVYSQSTAYTTARNGATIYTNTSFLNVGQSFDGTNYQCIEGYTQYDTSGIPSGATISSVTEQLYLDSDFTVTDFVEEVRARDWGGTLDTADYVAGGSLSSFTLLTSKTVAPAAGYNTFPTSAAFIAAVNLTGYTRLMHSSSRHRLGNTPTTNEIARWFSSSAAGTTQDPKLVVDYTLPITGSAMVNGASDVSITGQIVKTGTALLTGVADLSAQTFKSYLQFIAEPQANVRAPVATHVTVNSPTAYATSMILPEPSEATKIERIVTIDTGDAAVCQAIADELIGRWGRTQVSVNGTIPLELRLKFKEMVHIKYAEAGIDEPLVLQRKEHDVFAGTTSIVCGDIILDDNELIARMLQDLINK